jgi:hypothetical protein
MAGTVRISVTEGFSIMAHRFVRVVLLAMTVTSMACGSIDELPGEGAKAEEGYQLSEPIIAALESYHAPNGEYPDSLDALVPDYLTAIPSGEQIDELWYVRTDTSYTLSFSYTGPGMNACNYTPEAGEWACSGAY